MRRLRDGELLAAAGGLGLFVASLLPWYRIATHMAPLDRIAADRSAWQAFAVLDVVLALLALVPLVLVVAQATRESPSLPVALSVLSTAAGGLAVVLIAWRLLDQPGPNDLADVRWGAWLGLLSALVIALGGWRSTRQEHVPGAPPAPIQDLPVPAT